MKVEKRSRKGIRVRLFKIPVEKVIGKSCVDLMKGGRLAGIWGWESRPKAVGTPIGRKQDTKYHRG